MPLAERLKYLSNVDDWPKRTILEEIANSFADRLLRRRGFFVKDRRATFTRSALPFKWLTGRAAPIAVAAQEWTVEQGIDLGMLGEQAELAVQMRFVQPRETRRVFVEASVDGVVVARIRTKAGGRRSRADKKLFCLSLSNPGQTNVRLSLAARPVRYIAPGTPRKMEERLKAMPFKVTGVWLL